MMAARVRKPGSAGFSLVELLIAVLILLVGIVAVAQLVPTAIRSNFRNRYDSTALILAQRQLERMAVQSMTAGNPLVPGTAPVASAPYSFNYVLPNGQNSACLLGQQPPCAAPCAVDPGCPTCCSCGAVLVPNTLLVDWTRPRVPGYFNEFIVAGLTAAQSYAYETRWNVLTVYASINGVNRPVAKRILVSTRGGPAGPIQPTTLSTWVAWRED